ncbi:MAG: hypothetical protein ABS79_05695 [Planctomycetes bacterium SCN 63-9]|nr:MAG: hypothetical protein ABS79_05695 [Planctomycetes bacterium SCN 63-9]
MGVAVLASSSIAHAQQQVTYTTPAYTYQPSPASYAPQYYQTTYAPQYYQPTYATAPAPVTYTTQAQQPVYTPTSYVQAPQEATYAQTAQTTAAQAPQVAATAGDSYGFLNWLNSVRASYGLSAVGYDPNLESWASVNNGQQNARGMGHHVMGPARRQNSAMGAYPNITTMWMASPAHRAALLDPTIQWIGIAGMGAYWTFNAY